jgi:hypothetical protein
MDPVQGLRQLHRRLIDYLRSSYERYYSPASWLDAAEFPANPATVYRKDYMPVKYHRDSTGAWVE